MNGRTRMSWLRVPVARILNPITRRVAGRLPGFGLLTYRGRRSRRIYQTPINVWPHGSEYVFTLTYGSEAQWVKNVLAAGECWIRVRGRDVHLVQPEVIVDPSLRTWPGPVPLQLIGRLGGVSEFLRMRAAEPVQA